MPAKKGSKKLIAKQSLLGIFQKNKKLLINMEERIKEQEISLEQLSVVYSQDNKVLKDLTKKIDNQKKSETQEKYVENSPSRECYKRSWGLKKG